jgi:hypothetical protein
MADETSVFWKWKTFFPPDLFSQTCIGYWTAKDPSGGLIRCDSIIPSVFYKPAK